MHSLTFMVALSFASAPVSAVPISVTGGFTSLNSTVFGFGQTLVNGSVVCPDAGCQVAFGTANITFGTPLQSVVFENSMNEPNSIGFTPAPSQEVTGTGPSNTFLLGTLTFTNGTWNGDSTFGFELMTDSLSPSFDGQTLIDTLQLLLTPNDFVNGTPEENADLVYFSGNSVIGSARAYEIQDSPTGSNMFSVDVLGYIDSLHLGAFINPSGGGFVDPGIDLAPTPTSVPEPSTLALFCAVLALFGWGRRKGLRMSVSNS
jgi:hypothetical protein